VASAERTGVLVLRVWTEDEGSGFRARILHEQSLGSGERVSVAAASTEEVVEIVTHWLKEFVERER
jgi:hypothetical protein